MPTLSHDSMTHIFVMNYSHLIEITTLLLSNVIMHLEKKEFNTFLNIKEFSSQVMNSLIKARIRLFLECKRYLLENAK